MSDTTFEPGALLQTLERQARNIYLEKGYLIEVTPLAKKVSDVNCKVDMSNNLFKIIYPYAEEANKNIAWEQRISDLIKEFRRHANYDVEGKQLNFDLKIETNVKAVHGVDEVETYKNSKKVTKMIPIWAGWIPDERSDLVLLFGLRKE